MGQKKAVYIAGPMTGVDKYWEAFERAEDDLLAIGYIPISPSRNPAGLTYQQYMHICFGMINAADAILLLEDWENSPGARLEAQYCEYTGKPIVQLRTRDHVFGEKYPREIAHAWLKSDLEEAFKE